RRTRETPRGHAAPRRAPRGRRRLPAAGSRPVLPGKGRQRARAGPNASSRGGVGQPEVGDRAPCRRGGRHGGREHGPREDPRLLGNAVHVHPGRELVVGAVIALVPVLLTLLPAPVGRATHEVYAVHDPHGRNILPGECVVVRAEETPTTEVVRVFVDLHPLGGGGSADQLAERRLFDAHRADV